MKLYLEEETGAGETLTISKLKEVNSKEDAIKAKTANKCYLHICHHDTPKNGQCRPCIREEL